MKIYFILLIIHLLNTCKCFNAGWTQSLSSKPSNSRNHYQITECALFHVTFDYLKSKHAKEIQEEWLANEPANDSGNCPGALNLIKIILTRLKLSQSSYIKSVEYIGDMNRLVDLTEPFKSEAHFDDETFSEGARRIKTLFVSSSDAMDQNEAYIAQANFGRMLHGLQDFYSHSNWADFEIEKVNEELGRSLILGEVSDKLERACRACHTQKCRDDIVSELITNRVLTSGFFSKTKPIGKCSHGGFLDLTKRVNEENTEYNGLGINKDSIKSPHGDLHIAAANLATTSTYNILNDFWSIIGDEKFAKFLGLATEKSKNKLLLSKNPQLIFHNLLSRVKSAEPNTPIFTVVDSDLLNSGKNSSNNRIVFSELAALSIRKNIKINFLYANNQNLKSNQFASKRNIESFRDLADLSGGGFYSTPRADVKLSIFEFFSNQEIFKNSETFFIANLDSLNNVEKHYDWKILVGENLQSISFQISPHFKDLKFRVYDSNEKLLQTQSGFNSDLIQTFFINNPLQGIWKVKISSKTSFNLKILASTKLHMDMELTQSNGNPVHVGYAKIANSPVINTNLSLFVTMNQMKDKIYNASVQVVSKSSQDIYEQINATILNEFGGLKADFKAPDKEFRLKLVVCTQNSCFQRFKNNLFKPTALGIRVAEQNKLFMNMNETYQLKFTIRNYDLMNGSRLKLQVKDTMNLINHSEELVLPRSSKIQKSIEIPVPGNQALKNKQNVVTILVQPIEAVNNYFQNSETVYLSIHENNPKFEFNPTCEIIENNRKRSCSGKSICDSKKLWLGLMKITDVNEVGFRGCSIGLRNRESRLIQLKYEEGIFGSKKKTQLVGVVADCCAKNFQVVVSDNFRNFGKCVF